MRNRACGFDSPTSPSAALLPAATFTRVETDGVCVTSRSLARFRVHRTAPPRGCPTETRSGPWPRTTSQCPIAVGHETNTCPRVSPPRCNPCSRSALATSIDAGSSERVPVRMTSKESATFEGWTCSRRGESLALIRSSLTWLSAGSVASSSVGALGRVTCGGASPPPTRRVSDCYRGAARFRECLLAYHPGVIGLFLERGSRRHDCVPTRLPDPSSSRLVGPARMDGFCSRIGYTGRVPVDVLVGRVRANLLSAAPGSEHGHRYAALALSDQLEMLNRQLRAYNCHVAVLFEAHPDHKIFDSFPASGKSSELSSSPKSAKTGTGFQPLTSFSLRPESRRSRWPQERCSESGSATRATNDSGRQPLRGHTF